MAKKKKKRKEELVGEEYVGEAPMTEEEQDEGEFIPPSRRPTTTKPRNDAYVMMLAITFLALVAGCVLMYLDAAQYEGKNPPAAAIPALPELGKAATPSGQPGK